MDPAAGFAIIPHVLEAGELRGLDDALSTLGQRTRAGARHLMPHPTVAALAKDPRLTRLAGVALRDDDVVPYRATLFDKSPGSNWLVSWHQDTALPLRYRRETTGWGPWSVKAGVAYAHAPAKALEGVVALRVHLDDSGPENGPLRVLPRTHTLGVLSDDAVRDLSARKHSHECLVERGGILLMSPLLVHASSKARGSTPRRVLHIEYARSLRIGGGLELAVA